MRNRMTIVCATCLLLAIFLSGCAAVEPVHTIELEFMDHLEVGFVEQDVYMQGEADNEVVRIIPDMREDADVLAQPIFASADYVEHDEFQLSDTPLGPFPKGESLDVTFDEYYAASGSGTYTVQGSHAQLDFAFEKLFPNATYTLWCARVALPPVATIINWSCGEADGSNNSFTTDENGSGSISLGMPPRPDSTDERLSVFAIAYHSDGETYGDLPGDFGRVTHTHLVAPVPPPSADAWTTEYVQATTGP